MKSIFPKLIVLLFVLMFQIAWCNGNCICTHDGYSHINVKEGSVQGVPKGSSIDASINGHYLTVVFLENLGSVHIEVTDTNGGAVAMTDLYTPNGYIANIYNTGSYIVTFTLTNGDVYYGEFEVTD